MFENMFLLNKKDEKDLLYGILLTALHNICVMLPTVLLLFLASDMIQDRIVRIEGALFIYWGIALLLLSGIYWSYRLTYRKIYIAAYQESAATRINLAEKIRQLPLSYFGKKNLSDLSSTMMDDTATVEHALSTAVAEMFGGIISSLAMLIVLFFFDWRMSLALFICLPAAFLLIFVNLKVSPASNLKNRRAKLRVSEGVQEFLENIKELHASPQKESYRQGVEKIIRNVARTSMTYELIAGCTVSAAFNTLRIGLGFVVVTGAWLIARNDISLITFLLFLFVAVRIYDPLTTVIMMSAEYIYALVSRERIREIRDYPVQKGRSDIVLNTFDITFDHVSFAYDTQMIIDDVSFVAGQGETTALVGPSGSGKSTLSKLSCRFWDVSSGQILIDGRDINGIDPETLLGYFSIVFQDVRLFNDTIYNNIKIGKKDAAKEEVIAAARISRCEDFIRKLPNGYDTIIGENGKTLSGGERQRVSIARAFLKDAPIILLDEATASLDPENETLIQEAIGKLIRNKTVLIIAHRLPLIENCDKIVVLNQGRVQEMGKHKDLMALNGLYRRLSELQQKSLGWKAAT